MAKDLDDPGHFIGSVVISQRQAFPTDAPNYDVIDGQQRLTTLMLFLAAVRDHCPDGDISRERADSYMRNKFETGAYQFKIRPGDEDRPHVHAILDGKAEDSGGLPLSAYNYFQQRLNDLEQTEDGLDGASMVKALTSRLEIVQILTGPSDNAHRIFQTLNSTGKELTAVDLLRNHFFMLLPKSVDAAYDEYWHPMEQKLADRFPTFLWVDLVSRPKLETVPNRSDRVYSEWQAILDADAGDEQRVLVRLAELTDRATVFDQMVNASTGETDIDAQLSRLAEWGTNVHYPLTFAVLDLWRRREADSTRTARALACVESFLVRRMLAGVPTNNLNRVFTTSVGQLSSAEYPTSDLDVSVRRILSQPGKYWSSDEALLRDGLKSPFYERQRPTQRQFILRRIEERMAGKYAPDWTYCNFTIEHVLPNTATGWWLDHLGEFEEQPILAHEELRHTIGNLTLTCENPELGQMTFTDKCEVYANDILTMNDDITTHDRWGRKEILSRGVTLLEQATAIWIEPMPAEELDLHALASDISTVLEKLDLGRWTDIGELAEFLDASYGAIEKAVENVSKQDLADLVLEASGHLRQSQQSADRRERAITNLMESGVIGTAEDLPASQSMRVRAADLLADSGE